MCILQLGISASPLNDAPVEYMDAYVAALLLGRKNDESVEIWRMEKHKLGNQEGNLIILEYEATEYWGMKDDSAKLGAKLKGVPAHWSWTGRRTLGNDLLSCVAVSSCSVHAEMPPRNWFTWKPGGNAALRMRAPLTKENWLFARLSHAWFEVSLQVRNSHN